jgi:biofilm PGA synthesis N-glycosyltransferase PgaC
LKILFWAAVAMIGYTFVGYPIWLWIRAKWRFQPVMVSAFVPFVSIVMVVRNEEKVVEEKLRNLASLNYPETKIEIVVFSDGSTDRTMEILSSHSGTPNLRVLSALHSRGKASALNDAINAARGEVVVFTDARQKIESDAVLLLLENFADVGVGCASGELMLGDPQDTVNGYGLYWRIEKQMRLWESSAGSTVGATGAFYALRRNLFSEIPEETILDDVFVPLQVIRKGLRIVFDPRARAWDVADLGRRREFSRKVRTLAGNYQLLQLAPWLLTTANPVRFQFISHKLLRLVVPFALAVTFATSFFLPEPIYRAALGSQILFYGFSLLAIMPLKPRLLARTTDVAFTFVMLNTAAVVAFGRFVTGRKVVWRA